ncbi:MAG: GntR family transcriptional regulator [Fimbriimonadales bacterium]|nr:GntR family transcriptional regulator [Fimbriimonadales bacterium]
MAIRFNAETPRYVQVRQWVERQIVTGFWKPGDVLPPERTLAEQLGVSPLTVSRALQGLTQEGILIRKRRVGTIVAENLPPTLFQQSFTVMALGLGTGTRQPVDFYFSSIQRSILNTLAPLGLRTLWLDYQIDQIERELLSSEFMGILAIAPAAEHITLLEDLYRRGIPVVIVGASAEEWETPTVDTDNYGAARLAAKHLLELGHQRFVGLFGALETFNSRDRWRGFRDALHEAGVPESHLWTFATPYADEVGEANREAIRTVLRLPNRPTAIFAGGYYLALSVLQTLRQSGLSVPDDVSLIGFDDPPSAALLEPSLTTFRQPLEQLGTHAVQKLLDMAKGRRPEPLHEYLPVELIVRQSTAAPLAKRQAATLV